MKTIEISSKTDAHGHLRIEPLFGKPERNVRILMLLADEVEDADDEHLWLDEYQFMWRICARC